MASRLRRAHSEWHWRREWRRHLASLEPWLDAATYRALVYGMLNAQGSPSGRAFVGVQDVLAEARQDLRKQAALLPLLSAKSRGDSSGNALDKAREDTHRADTLEIPAWTAAAALRRRLEKRKLPIDTDAYDPAYDRPESWRDR